MQKAVPEPKENATKSYKTCAEFLTRKPKVNQNQTKQNTFICPVGLDKMEEFK